jgi:endonuclease YncB( thermonuclease family)
MPATRPLTALLALVLVLLWPFAAGAAAPRSFAGTVTHVSDGDTVWVRAASGGAPQPVRLQGIDAPELCQAWGPQAREALARRVLHQPVTVTTRGRDGYDRLLGQLQWSGQDMGRWLVASGLAWSPGFQGRPGPYASQQALARQARRGLWADAQPLEPRRFRRLHGACPHPSH